MYTDQHPDGSLADALHALLTMNPDEIEAAERKLRENGTNTMPVEASALVELRLTRAAAVQAAQLWRGCIPLTGYCATGPVENGAVGNSLSVTG